MFGQWQDFEKAFAAMDELRRRMERSFDGWDSPLEAFPAVGESWPRTSLHDEGENLVLRAEVPGVRQEDLDVSLTEDVLTLSGQRRLAPREGYSAHRQERRPYTFSRSFSLPNRVAGDKIAATLEHGVLTVVLPKAPESRPRRVAVKAA
jgi:HSP20 family protein